MIPVINNFVSITKKVMQIESSAKGAEHWACLFLLPRYAVSNFRSPGFTAAYCTYVLLDLHSTKVVALWVAQKNMVIVEQLLPDKLPICVN